MASNLVSMDWLLAHLHDPEVRVVDCRFVLGQPDAGVSAYQQGHLPGAVYFDLERDLSAPKAEHGGRHPLPDAMLLAAKLGAQGIGNGHHIVAYDDQGGAMASRFWWLLKYLGHERVSVLNGSYTAWKAAGHPVTAEAAPVSKTEFIAHSQTDFLVHMNEVRTKLGDPGTVLIDSREAVRYQGLQEPIDPVAGHIPGAVNHFWKDSLQEDGTWKTADEQRERFADIDPDKEVIVYCGSGVTATPNILALQEAGHRKVRLYLGSWSDWCSYPENPIATSKEEG
ncbi:thiosulfate/3-mercaptopyruvate sulfurtransferase [Tumebacillus sp. BK434]|uniref:sulfurtransferase n=1 Tax=Tumebacillus sp. BK434 TaxID=2512169 RepID=UPI001053CF76|nr:sulfurtransferase [Tumebacillus sp. BK434]TCP57614.1 thiosulfate/3-mercaptopyruvate sulfurtransferase [Tumebacillus sp. BK434]